ncbi:MAG: nucleoside triphosphate pyrophosphohydrolase [Treponema sp.]|nr:nucleoside triphosphate pyrophosphohydrolase [Treponema sp.]
MMPGDSFKALYETIVKLRSPGGCKWDREQTPSTLRGALVEETYECLEAIDENDPSHAAEELGDLFLLVTMIGYMYEQEGKFSVADALLRVNEKLIRRHPHVFAGVAVKDTSEILDNWIAIKINQEGRKPKDSVLDEVSSGFPPMDKAYALQKKAAKAGFDWQAKEGVIDKIREELDEVCAVSANAISALAASNAVANNDTAVIDTSEIYTAESNAEENLAAVEDELGDLLFSVINLCRFLKVEPSIALRRTNSKFTERFKYVEKRMKESNREMNIENLGIMDEFWAEAKKISIV